MALNRRRQIGLALLALGLAGLAASLIFLRDRPAPKPQGVAYERAAFSELAGWRRDDLAAAFKVFKKSCARRLTLPGDRAVRPEAVAGTVADWRGVCSEALEMPAPNSETARRYFEANFTPLAVTVDGSPRGLFTGYYEPLLDGALDQSDAYPVPLYQRPPELVTVDLGVFRADLKGRRIAGEVKGGRLVPFPSRASIDQGALADRELELLWASDPVDVFFLQIQGSGRVRLPNGRILRIGYDGPNGHPYTSLGRLMVERKILHPDRVSSPAIARWLKENPVAARELMQENASYIFFRLLEGEGPIGAEGIALTPRRSLAVDRRHLPLGAPVWLQTRHPNPVPGESEPIDFHRLMVAQDVGGAITGGVRGDVFWGFGRQAEIIAGHMAHRGRYFLLLPNALAERLLSGAQAKV